jgi:hypothetical protein
MWSKVKRRRKTGSAWFAAFSVLLAFASPSVGVADATTDEADEADAADDTRDLGWLVGIQVPVGVTINEQFGDATSIRYFTEGPNPGPVGFIRQPVSGTDTAVSPYVGFGLELWSPIVPVIPGNLRIFVNAEILPTFGTSRSLASETAPGPFEFPGSTDDPTQVIGATILGQGTRTKSQVMTTMLAAAIGVSIPVKSGERQLFIKPSLGWMRFGLFAEGQLHQAYKDDPIPLSFPFGEEVRTIPLSGRGVKFYNAIGPGLEIELVTGTYGPVRPSLYIGGGAYWLVDREAIVFDTFASYERQGFTPGIPAEDYYARWSVTPDAWIFRAGVGLRIMWLGRK